MLRGTREKENLQNRDTLRLLVDLILRGHLGHSK